MFVSSHWANSCEIDMRSFNTNRNVILWYQSWQPFYAMDIATGLTPQVLLHSTTRECQPGIPTRMSAWVVRAMQGAKVRIPWFLSLIQDQDRRPMRWSFLVDCSGMIFCISFGVVLLLMQIIIFASGLLIYNFRPSGLLFSACSLCQGLQLAHFPASLVQLRVLHFEDLLVLQMVLKTNPQILCEISLWCKVNSRAVHVLSCGQHASIERLV